MISTGSDRDQGLRNWQNLPHYSLSADGGSAEVLSQAAANGQRVFIRYDGGSTPGATRWIHPRDLFGVSGYGGYVRGYCEKRQEERTFRIDKITSLSVADVTLSSRKTRASAQIAVPPTAAIPAMLQQPAARGGVPAWVWIVGIIVVLWILSNL